MHCVMTATTGGVLFYCISTWDQLKTTYIKGPDRPVSQPAPPSGGYIHSSSSITGLLIFFALVWLLKHYTGVDHVWK